MLRMLGTRLSGLTMMRGCGEELARRDGRGRNEMDELPGGT